MLRCTLLLLLVAAQGWSKIVVYEGTGTDCDTLLYTEAFGLTIAENAVIDLTGIEATATCSKTSDAPTMVIAYGDVADNVKDLKVSISFSSTATGYWNTNMLTVSYNDSASDVTLTGRFTSASMVGTAFSFACSLHSTTTLVSTTPAKKAVVSLDKYQLQAYNVKDSAFSESYQCVNWISKGAWMGVFSGVIMIVVLVMSVMMLLSTATPDRFETTKSKCLIIPHEH